MKGNLHSRPHRFSAHVRTKAILNMRLRDNLFILLAVTGLPLAAQQPAVDFNKQVQPILDTNCTVCHKGNSAPSGLHLDTAAGLMKGSASGAVIVAGKSKDSLLVQRISDTTGSQMPPAG